MIQKILLNIQMRIQIFNIDDIYKNIEEYKPNKKNKNNDCI